MRWKIKFRLLCAPNSITHQLPRTLICPEYATKHISLFGKKGVRFVPNEHSFRVTRPTDRPKSYGMHTTYKNTQTLALIVRKWTPWLFAPHDSKDDLTQRASHVITVKILVKHIVYFRHFVFIIVFMLGFRIQNGLWLAHQIRRHAYLSMLGCVTLESSTYSWPWEKTVALRSSPTAPVKEYPYAFYGYCKAKSHRELSLRKFFDEGIAVTGISWNLR